MRFPPGLAPVRVDANQLELALLNLAVNARDAMPAGGTITITARVGRRRPEEHGGWRLGLRAFSVADNGEGMDEATLARAASPSSRRKASARGPASAWPWCTAWRPSPAAHLLLRSRRGAGTVAETLAAAPPAQMPEGRTAAETAARCRRRRRVQPRTVLLVDDDPLVLASTAAMIEDLGHIALEADSARQALALLRTGRPVDLIITDYAMPVMTGVQLAAEARRLRPGLPVVLATGYAELPGDDTPGAAPGLPRLMKPFSAEALAVATEAPFAA